MVSEDQVSEDQAMSEVGTNGTAPESPATDEADDQILTTTRAVSAVVAPILVVAGVLLYAFPASTERLWAWPMGPEMTALAVGGGYLAGAVLFLRAARQSRWHVIALVFPVAGVLTLLLLVATLLHWEMFSHGHLSFWTWLVVYLVTPVLLPAVWLANRRRDPGRAASSGPLVPDGIRFLVAAVGGVQMALALLFFIRPTTAIEVWPWSLSPLTTRTIAAFLAFIAAMWLAFLLEARWSALRLHVQSAALGLGLVGVGALRASDDFSGQPVETTVFAVVLGTALLGLVALQLGMSRATRRR